jgi:IS1 family transposase
LKWWVLRDWKEVFERSLQSDQQWMKGRYSSVRDIVVGHEWSRSLEETVKNLKTVVEVNPTGMWYMNGKWPRVCWAVERRNMSIK